MKVYLHNLGCDKNLVDGEKLLARLAARGYEHSTQAEGADLVVVNTCGFIEQAKEESLDAVFHFAKTKKVAVVGCLAERYAATLKTELKEADVVLGLADAETTLNGFLNRYGALEKPCSGPPRIITTPRHTSPIKVSEGCNRGCAFCAIPLIRGAHTARPVEEILNEAKFLRSSGVRELLVVAQDPTAYGQGVGLHGLLRQIARLDSPFDWIRLMYVHPAGVTDALIDCLASEPAMAKYIDMPLQHISDPMLKRMNRSYTRERAETIIQKLRDKIPGIAIRTTFMVGFPGETESDFEELSAFVRDMAFERAGVFAYSPEEGTSAFALKGRVSEPVMRERMEILEREQQRISAEKNLARVGTVVKVLVDGQNDDGFSGRTEQDAPEVDGSVTVVDTGLSTGEFYKVAITSGDETGLRGKLVKN